MEFSMSDSDYLTRAEAVLAAIESALDEIDADIELERSGNVLTLEFENRTKIIVNLQPPMSEIWIAAKAGGFHYRFVDGEWRDTRSGAEFFAALSQYATQQAGEPVQFAAQ
jgi:CyaY protein